MTNDQTVTQALDFIDNFFEPWGSWKTAWWEGEVSDNAAFSADNALKHVANILRRTAHSGEGRSIDAALSAPQGEVERLRETCINVAAHLAAAISLLEKGGSAAKKAAPSDKMFDQMIRDYKRSLSKARAALKQQPD